MKVGGSYLAQTGWGLYENILGDYLIKAGTPRFRNEREIFVFFNRFWQRMRKDYSFVNDQPMEDDKSPFADLDASFLIVNRGGIFHVTGQMSVTRFTRVRRHRIRRSLRPGRPAHALRRRRRTPRRSPGGRVPPPLHFDISCGGALDVFTIKLQGSRRA